MIHLYHDPDPNRRVRDPRLAPPLRRVRCWPMAQRPVARPGVVASVADLLRSILIAFIAAWMFAGGVKLAFDVMWFFFGPSWGCKPW